MHQMPSEDKLKKMREYQFELGSTGALSWLDMAYTLKHAADRLFDLHHDAAIRQMDRFYDEIQQSHFFVETLEGARDLLESERADSRDSDLRLVYYMLAGYAIENLLKGAIMLAHPEYFRPDGELVAIKTHSLIYLWKKCDLALSVEEEILLDKLQRYVEWQGKYPVPLKACKILPLPRKDGTWDQQSEQFKGRQTQGAVDRLYDKAHQEFLRQEEIRDARRKRLIASSSENSGSPAEGAVCSENDN